MFAVPGWSISADALKSQVEKQRLDATEVPGARTPDGIVKKSRKRKRVHDSHKSTEVTAENLGDLWKKHIEQKDSKSLIGNKEELGKSKNKKKQRGSRVPVEEADDLDNEALASSQNDNHVENTDGEKLITKKKKGKREKKKPEHFDEGNSHGQAAENPPRSAEKRVSIEDGKSKYEKRKVKAAQKRYQKALLLANGTLPPTRPEPNSAPANESVPPVSLKSSKASNTPETKILLGAILGSKRPDVPKAQNQHPSPNAPDPPSTSAKLTPLQQRMAAKLTSARFRHLNQTLYTSPSDQAMRLFAESPQSYASYHAGFRAQVAVWPQNPVEGFIEDIKLRGSVSIPSQRKLWREQKKGKKPKGDRHNISPNGDPTRAVDPLPRNKQGTCTIADLGCGDATLAFSLFPSKKALNLNLLSFDLAKGDTPNANLITVADISNLSAAGIKDGSLDIAICCLSLMGTNWVDVVAECSRIVRTGGEVWVAEIKSRFVRAEQVVRKRGDGIGREKKKKKGQSNDEGEDDDPADPTEVEEETDPLALKDKTDVSAFVRVFRKRGFNLKGEPDMSNKMFVRMRFVKAFSRPVEMKADGFGNGFQGKQERKFLDGEKEGDVDEGRVLKPCVYKTR